MAAAVVPPPPRGKKPTRGETLITDTFNDRLPDCADCTAQTAVNREHIGLKPHGQRLHATNRPGRGRAAGRGEPRVPSTELHALYF